MKNLLRISMQFFAENDDLNDLDSLVEQIREQIPETERALTSDSFSRLTTMYNSLFEDNTRLRQERDSYRERQAALISENNRLYTRIKDYDGRMDYKTSPNPHIVSDNTDNPEPAEKLLDIDSLLFGEEK